MPLPTDDLIVWASSDVNLPNLAGPNKVKPIDDLILKGWDFKQKPAADEFNYVLNNLGMHVSYLEESKTYTFTGDLVGTATSIGSDNVTFDVSVVSNSHNHTSANISDATSLNTPNMVVRRDSNGDVAANYIRAEAYFDGDLQGNADTASALQTARTISISGDGSGSVSFNGTSNISIPLVIADNSHNHISANISDATSANNSNTVVKRGASGEVSVGNLTVSKVGGVSTVNFPGISNDTGYIKHSETNDVSRMQFSISDNNESNDKFEFGNTQGGSFVPKFTIDSNGTTNVKSSVTATNFIGPLQGNALTSATWQTSRTITLSGDVSGSVSMNGGSNVTITTSVADNSHNHTSANISDATSLNTPNMVVRRDSNGDVAVRYVVGGLTGNALTATTLETPRTINGTSFNGGSNITTSSWGTSRTLTLAGAVTGSVSINGSGDVTLNTSVSSTSGVSILTGTVANGGTIPLPSGYSESQCKWYVSFRNTNPNGNNWDWAEGTTSNHIQHICSADNRLAVVCYTTVLDGASTETHNGTANYIIIGVK